MPAESLTYKQQSDTPAQTSLSLAAEKESDVLNVREASRLLRVHPNKLTALARRGLIPAGVVGSRWRFSRLALLAHLSKPRQGPIKPTRKLAEYPPAKLIARIQKLGGNLALVNGRLVLEGLKREEVGAKLWAALEKNQAKLVQELK